MPYSVPAGYFDTLEKKLGQTISNKMIRLPQEELEELSPLLSGLKKKQLILFLKDILKIYSQC